MTPPRLPLSIMSVRARACSELKPPVTPGHPKAKKKESSVRIHENVVHASCQRAAFSQALMTAPNVTTFLSESYPGLRVAATCRRYRLTVACHELPRLPALKIPRE